MSRPEEEYREFVGSRAASLHRTAYLLCGDWHLADDLVQETFVQTFRHWRRVQRADNQNAYVKHILINEFKRHWQPVQRWNLPEGWVISARPAIVTEADFVAAQDLAASRGPHSPGHHYQLGGLLGRGTCGRLSDGTYAAVSVTLDRNVGSKEIRARLRRASPRSRPTAHGSAPRRSLPRRRRHFSATR